jgi:Zn-dependent peptidase ImmA (M78 family)
LCHELAHRLIRGGKNDLDHEKVMHRFASAFLMPASGLKKEFGDQRHALAYAEIMSAKHFYGVSAAALIIRLRDLGIIRDGYLSYLFQTLGRTWRSTEPDPLLEQGERARAKYRSVSRISSTVHWLNSSSPCQGRRCCFRNRRMTSRSPSGGPP